MRAGAWGACVWVAGVVIGCGSSRAEPPSPVASEDEARALDVEETPAPNEETATNEASDPSAPECEDAFDCTIVRDRCGEPHGLPIGRALDRQPPDPCPPADYALVEPACEAGRCVPKVVDSWELRVCHADSECVVIPWACGGHWAVARARRAEAEEHVRRVSASRACRNSSASPPPAVSCLANVCVTRDPESAR